MRPLEKGDELARKPYQQWLIKLLNGLTLSLGAQTEWTHQHGFGSGTLNTIAYTFTSPAGLAVNPATLAADYDQDLPWKTPGPLHQNSFTRSVLRTTPDVGGHRDNRDSGLQASGNYIDNPNYSSQSIDMRAGFSTSPWRSISLSAHYRRYEDDSNYQPNQNVQPVGGYPGFPRSRDLLTDEAEAKLGVASERLA